MRKRGPRKFTEEFRREAVRLATESDRTLKELAAELGVSPPTLRQWMREVPKEKQASAVRVVSRASRMKLSTSCTTRVTS